MMATATRRRWQASFRYLSIDVHPAIKDANDNYLVRFD